VDFVVGDLVDFMVGVLVESLDPLASLGLLVFLLILGPLVDFRVGDLVDLRSLAKAVAQIRAKIRKRVLMEFIFILVDVNLQEVNAKTKQKVEL
jgi:hypothetical protein